jgi:endonuclease G, mitochondrial
LGRARRAFWSLIGGPFEGKYRNASVLHDVGYEQKTHSAEEVDRMFYNAMRCSGVGMVEAKTMYYALHRHGRHWKVPIRRAKPAELSEIAPPAERATTVDPGEVDAIQKWIEANNPSLEQIEARANAQPR